MGCMESGQAAGMGWARLYERASKTPGNYSATELCEHAKKLCSRGESY